MKHGAIHTPNQDAHHLLKGASQRPMLMHFDYFIKTPPDGNMLLNDQLGCCVSVARDWWVRAFTASVVGEVLPISNAMIMDDYQLNGYDPKNPEQTDNGIDTSDHMRRWQAEPCLDINNGPHAIWWTKVDPTDPHQFMSAMTVTPCLMTLLLPDAVEQDVGQWGRPPGTGASWEPNPDNAHRVLVGKFDRKDMWVNTWGMHPYVHWEFMLKYAAKDGFDVPVPRDLSDDMMLDFAGLDLESFEKHRLSMT